MGVENVYVVILININSGEDLSSYDDIVNLFNQKYPNNKIVITGIYLLDGSIIETNRVLDHNGIMRDSAYISSMWLNAAYQHNNHVAHTHPNSIFSGVVYLQCPKNSQQLIFWDPRPQTSIMQLRSTIEQSYASIDPTVGIMALWPSWLMHSTQSVTTVELSQPRLSIAFNIMIKDTIDIPNARIKLS